MNANKIFTILFSLSLLFVSSISFAINNIEDDDPIKNKKYGVRVVTSTVFDGDATIKWNDNRIDYLEITLGKEQFMPSIPVLEATSLHLHDLMNGVYLIQFKSEGEVLYYKEITVQR